MVQKKKKKARVDSDDEMEAPEGVTAGGPDEGDTPGGTATGEEDDEELAAVRAAVREIVKGADVYELKTSAVRDAVKEKFGKQVSQTSLLRPDALR